MWSCVKEQCRTSVEETEWSQIKCFLSFTRFSVNVSVVHKIYLNYAQFKNVSWELAEILMWISSGTHLLYQGDLRFGLLVYEFTVWYEWLILAV